MGTTPRFKVYSPLNAYVAACKHVEDAAALVSIYGDGATIRDGATSSRRTVWTEGRETISAGESYDTVASTVWERIRNRD